MDGFVVDGNNAALASSGVKINGVGPNIDAHNGIDTLDPINGGQAVSNLTIQNNIVQNVNHDGIALINAANGSAVSSGSVITGNVVSNFLDYGVVLAYNAYADVTYNTITMPDLAEAGVWVYDFTANGATAAEQTINVAHNTITAGQDDYGGIWANLDYAPNATLYITDNTVNAAAGVTGTDGYTNGIYLSSLQNGFGAQLSGNSVGATGGQFATGISLWNLPTTNTVTVSGGSVGNSLIGIGLTNDDINFGLTPANTLVSISGVSISGGDTGIFVQQHSSGGTVDAAISGVAINDPSTGIDVDGGSATISGAHIFNNMVGIQFHNGGTGSVATTNFDGGVDLGPDMMPGGGDDSEIPDNGTDLLIQNTGVSIGSGNAFAGDTFFIDDQSTQSYDLSSNGTTFDETNNYRIEDKMHHAMDSDRAATDGLVTWVAGNVYVTDGGTDHSIQRGVDVASSGDTVNVEGGTYVESVNVGKAITIDGEGSGPTPLATITAASSGTTLINVTSTNAADMVTIRDLAFEGVNGAIVADLGINVPSSANFDTLAVDQSSFDGLHFNGIQVLGNTTTGISAHEVVITNSGFTNNGYNNGGAGDIDLFTYNGDATLQNLNLSNNGALGSQFGIQLRGVGNGAGGGVLPMGTVSFDNVDISGSYTRQFVGIQRYSDVTNLSFNDLKLGGATSQLTGTFGAAMRFDLVGQGTSGSPATVDLGNTDFRGFNPSSPLPTELEFAPDNTYAFLKADATGTSWNLGGTEYAASALTPAQAFAVEDSILDYVDPDNGGQPYKGWALLQTGNAFVTADVPTFVDSLDRGIEMVDTNGTVYASSGTYVESPHITKSVSLIGEGRDTTTIQLLAADSAPTYLGALEITGAGTNATVQGFTIVGANAVGSGLANSGILLDRGLGTIHILDNRIETGAIGAGANGDDGIGLLTTYTTTPADFVASLDVENNEFQPTTGVGYRAFYINSGVTSFEFKNNTIQGDYEGRSITEANDATIELNAITGTGAAGSRSAGIGVYGDTDSAVLGHADIKNNDFDNLSIAVSVLSANNVTVENNNFTNNDTGVLVDNSFGGTNLNTTTDSIHENSFATSNTLGVNNTTGVLVDATSNWWGDAEGPNSPDNLYHPNNPAGVAVSGMLTLAPWLTDGTDTSATRGFQPNLTAQTPSVGIAAAPGNDNSEGSSQSFTATVSGTTDSITYYWTVTKDGNPYAANTVSPVAEPNERIFIHA